MQNSNLQTRSLKSGASPTSPLFFSLLLACTLSLFTPEMAQAQADLDEDPDQHAHEHEHDEHAAVETIIVTASPLDHERDELALPVTELSEKISS